MTFRKSILLLVGLSMFAALAACGGSSHHTTTTPPPVITVSLSTIASTLAVNSTAQITATTTDTAGVSWTCTPTASCGSLSPTTTTTGVATTYTAPAAPTSGVVITATSVTTSSISASAPAITISQATALADGNYVFSLAGEDANSNFYVAGEITIAGGLITTGEQDFIDGAEDRFDQINGTANATGMSTIASTPDGNLQITLVTCNGGNCSSSDTNIGVAGTETLNGTILPLSTTGRTFITEFDASASASGELDPQDLAGAGSTPPANGYAFVLNGYDPGGAPLAVGGIINVDGAGTISGTGSIFDANDAGTTFPSQLFAASTVLGPTTPAPDPLGRVTFTLNSANFSQINLAGYIVNSSRIQLVEVIDTYNGTLGGLAYSQGATNTGTFTAASAAGTYVVGVTGFDVNGVLQAVTQLSLVAGAGVTGFVDYNDLATSSGTSPSTSPDPVTAAGYTVDATGDITIAGVTDSGATVSYNVQLYLDGNGHALAITMDANDAVAGAGFTQGAGVTSTSFNGPYALDVTGDDDTANEFELDGVGPVSVTAGTISGTVDLNWLSTATTYPATAVSGTATGTTASNGIFTGTITGVDVNTCITVGVSSCSVDNFSYYLIDATGDNIAIETDENQLTLGFFLQQ